MKRSGLLLLLGFVSQALMAQHIYRLGVIPGININKKLNQDFRLNLKSELRFLTTEGEFSHSSRNEIAFNTGDFSVNASRKTGVSSTFAVGYLFRIREGQFHHRVIQQFTRVSNFDAFRLAHRFSSDQTFYPDESPQYRIRYRISSDFALNGQSVDARELYLKINHEYVYAIQDRATDLEIRAVPVLGFAISDNNKLESGLDYRINGFVEDKTRSSFWLLLNWYLSI